MKKVASSEYLLVQCDADIGLACAGKVTPYAATGSTMFFMLKAFGAGVILATGFIHMWPDANDAFSNSCLGGFPLSSAKHRLNPKRYHLRAAPCRSKKGHHMYSLQHGIPHAIHDWRQAT